MIKAEVVAITTPTVDDIPGHEELIAYCARSSSPDNQSNHHTANRLMAYCASHDHWSVFEMASVTVYIEAPRDITRQLLRHRSLHFQEFSQRYAVPDLDTHITRELRFQHPTNRQASTSVDDPDLKKEWEMEVNTVSSLAKDAAEYWLQIGAAKECVRVLYPEGLTMSRLYAHGTLRDFWHYCRVRMGHGTQPEHVELATKIYEAIEKYYPQTWTALKESERMDRKTFRQYLEEEFRKLEEDKTDQLFQKLYNQFFKRT